MYLSAGRARGQIHACNFFFLFSFVFSKFFRGEFFFCLNLIPFFFLFMCISSSNTLRIETSVLYFFFVPLLLLVIYFSSLFFFFDCKFLCRIFLDFDAPKHIRFFLVYFFHLIHLMEIQLIKIYLI